MTTYPWGPHGPQSSAHSVTPNPTASYVPPPAAPAYNSFGGYGGNYAANTGGGFAGYAGPPRKSYVTAVILSGIFGPLGLFYANAKAAKILLLIVVANVVIHVMSAPASDISRAGGLWSFISDSSALASAWSLATACSVALALLGIRSYRKKLAKEE